MKELLWVFAICVGGSSVLGMSNASINDEMYCYSRLTDLTVDYIVCLKEQYLSKLVIHLNTTVQRPIDPTGEELRELIAQVPKNATEEESCACNCEGTDIKTMADEACNSKIYKSRPNFLQWAFEFCAKEYEFFISFGKLDERVKVFSDNLMRKFLAGLMGPETLYEQLTGLHEMTVIEAKHTYDHKIQNLLFQELSEEEEEVFKENVIMKKENFL